MYKERTTKKGRKRNFNGWQKDAMREMRNKGTTYAEIGRKFNCTGNTVKYLTNDEFRTKQREYFNKYQQRKKGIKTPIEEKQPIEKPTVEQHLDEKIREILYKAFLAEELAKINKTNEITNEMKEAYLEKLVINRVINRIIEISKELGIPKIIETMITTPTRPDRDRLDNFIYGIGKGVFNTKIGSMLDELGLRKTFEEHPKGYYGYLGEEKAKERIKEEE
jgi:hypothetical protein